MTRVTVRYFAALRDAAGIDAEVVETASRDLAGVYAELQTRHGFAFPMTHLRVAADGAFARGSDAPREGGEIVFIPPVSGG